MVTPPSHRHSELSYVTFYLLCGFTSPDLGGFLTSGHQSQGEPQQNTTILISRGELPAANAKTGPTSSQLHLRRRRREAFQWRRACSGPLRRPWWRRSTRSPFSPLLTEPRLAPAGPPEAGKSQRPRGPVDVTATTRRVSSHSRTHAGLRGTLLPLTTGPRSGTGTGTRPLETLANSGG